MKKKMKLILKIFIGIIIIAILIYIINLMYKKIHSDNLKNKDWIKSHVHINKNSNLGTNIYSIDKPSDINIYNENYIDVISNYINDLTSDDNDFSNAIIIYNPYGTNNLGFNIYFRTDELSSLNYSISVDDKNISTYSNTLNNDGKNNLNTNHKYQIIGFVPGYVNTLKLKLKDSNNKTIETRTIKINLKNIKTDNEVKLESTSGTSKSNLSNGLYTILGNDSDSKDYVTMYDNNGILRVEIPIIGYRAHNILFKDNSMYFSISQTKIAEIDALGRVTNIYKTGNYQLHHDYTFDDDGNLIVLANNTKKDTEEDCIIKIDLKTKKVTELVDMENIFKSYVKTCELDTTSTRDEGEDGLDWLHLNSIEYVDGDVILSSRETSSIIKLSNIQSKPTLTYILADTSIWKNTEFSGLVYEKIGDFKIHAGQHSVRLTKTSDENIYYLTFYNNNYGKALSQPKFDYSKIGIENNNAFTGDNSYYYVYKVNEINKTFELMDSMKVSYSGIVSSVQILSNNNILIDSGTKGIYSEYDENKKLIKSFTVKLNKYMAYRVLKYDFNNFWFYGS